MLLYNSCVRGSSCLDPPYVTTSLRRAVGTWADDYTVAESEHTVLVNKSAITGYKPYDWVAWLSCKWAEGKTSDTDIFDAIGTKACDDDASEQVISGVNFNYEMSGVPDETCVDLLEYRPYGGGYSRYGNCHVLAGFLQELARVQNITVVRDSVDSAYAEDKNNPLGTWHLWSTDKKDRDGNEGPGLTVGPYVFFDNEWVWISHAFVSYGNRVFDPATGNDGNNGWKDYFLSLMTRYIESSSLNSEVRSNLADKSVWVMHGKNGNLDPDWDKLPEPSP